MRPNQPRDRLKLFSLAINELPKDFIFRVPPTDDTVLPSLPSSAVNNMAEILGVVASGNSAASLAIQIVGSLNKVITFYQSIKEAPIEIRQILVELQMLSRIMLKIRIVYEKHSLPESGKAMIEGCLQLVEHDIRNLLDRSTDLERKLSSNTRIARTWGRVQTVLSDTKIALLRIHLEHAKGGLQLLQICQI